MTGNTYLAVIALICATTGDILSGTFSFSMAAYRPSPYAAVIVVVGQATGTAVGPPLRRRDRLPCRVRTGRVSPPCQDMASSCPSKTVVAGLAVGPSRPPFSLTVAGPPSGPF